MAKAKNPATEGQQTPKPASNKVVATTANLAKMQAALANLAATAPKRGGGQAEKQLLSMTWDALSEKLVALYNAEYDRVGGDLAAMDYANNCFIALVEGVDFAKENVQLDSIKTRVTRSLADSRRDVDHKLGAGDIAVRSLPSQTIIFEGEKMVTPNAIGVTINRLPEGLRIEQQEAETVEA
jgi:hypothetical protein